MRKAFECGDISSEDFWHHTGWLIEAKTTSLLAQGYYVRYVHPSMISESAKKFIQEFSRKSPIQLKYVGLLELKKEKLISNKDEKILDEYEREFANVLKSA